MTRSSGVCVPTLVNETRCVSGEARTSILCCFGLAFTICCIPLHTVGITFVPCSPLQPEFRMRYPALFSGVANLLACGACCSPTFACMGSS